MPVCDEVRLEDVDDDLDVDLADALQRAPEKRVLVEQLTGPGRLHGATAELDAVTFQEPEQLRGDDEGRLLRVAFEAQQALEAGLPDRGGSRRRARRRRRRSRSAGAARWPHAARRGVGCSRA